MLAKILKDLHPVKKCRDQFAKNQAQSNNEEELIELQAATAWDCVGVSPSDIMLCGSDGRGCKASWFQKPLTRIRNVNARHTLIKWEEMEQYRNFELEIGDQLGACFQPKGTGGPKLLKLQEQERSHLESDKDFKKRIGNRKTAWLRACSYWSAFHALALRADALGKWTNELFGSIVRIIAGGALFCGG